MNLFSATLTTLAFAGCQLVAAELKGEFDRTLTVSGPVDLDVVTDSGGISVRPGTAGEVKVHAILRGHQESRYGEKTLADRIHALEQNPPIEQSGGTVRIGYVHDKSLLKGVSVRFEILTPADSRVRARADSGGIRVEGVKGPADCKTDSGGIEIRDIGSEVRAGADSGGIRIHKVQGSVVAHADSGGIEAIEIAGAVEVTTDSGGVEVAQITPAPVHIRADSGGAHVRLASTGGYDINASADSGRITVPEIAVHGTNSSHRVEGKVRGGGPLVDVKVDSGNVHIE